MTPVVLNTKCDRFTSMRHEGRHICADIRPSPTSIKHFSAANVRSLGRRFVKQRNLQELNMYDVSTVKICYPVFTHFFITILVNIKKYVIYPTLPPWQFTQVFLIFFLANHSTRSKCTLFEDSLNLDFSHHYLLRYISFYKIFKVSYL